MKEFGYKEVKLWFDQGEHEMVKQAARLEGKRVATWIRELVVTVATARIEADKDDDKKPK